MKKFYLTNEVTGASGWQRFYVVANTLSDAKSKLADDPGCFEFESESIEVTNLGPDRWEDDN